MMPPTAQYYGYGQPAYGGAQVRFVALCDCALGALLLLLLLSVLMFARLWRMPHRFWPFLFVQFGGNQAYGGGGAGGYTTGGRYYY